MTRDERRAYAEAEAEEAGCSAAEIADVVDAAMSANDDQDPDDFEVMVASIIEGVAERREAFSLLDRAFGSDWRA